MLSTHQEFNKILSGWERRHLINLDQPFRRPTSSVSSRCCWGWRRNPSLTRWFIWTTWPECQPLKAVLNSVAAKSSKHKQELPKISHCPQNASI